jgi:ribonuclease VapC
MVIDSSAVLAILFGEHTARSLAFKIDADATRLMAAANALESAIAVERRYGQDGGDELDRLLLKLRIEIVATTPEHFDLAREAWRRYGKGRHPAALNICDCLAYALSKATGEPLLFVGDDFAKTDVAAA